MIEQVKLMKPLFDGNNFNQAGRRMRAAFWGKVTNGTVCYRLWQSTGKPDISYPRTENDKYLLYVEINEYLVPLRETGNSYEMDIDLPGFKKDEVSADLKDGYLSISAAKGLDKDEKDKKGKYIRQERHAGACSRSFYVGEGVEAKDVSAKFEDGILKISLPKQEQKQLPKSSAIAIE